MNASKDFFIRRAYVIFIRKLRRRKLKLRKIAGESKFLANAKINRIKKGIYKFRNNTGIFKNRSKEHFRFLTPNIVFLKSIKKLFSEKDCPNTISDGRIMVPECFSLMDNYEESFDFLKQLFVLLSHGRSNRIILDYKNCTRIDVDASLCMDVLLREFITYIDNCKKKRYNVNPKKIGPDNLINENVDKVLYSVGAQRNLGGIHKEYPDVIALPVLTNSKNNPRQNAITEVQTTQIVNYIKECLKKMNRTLSVEARTGLYKVLGEVMTNADHHCTMNNRYAIGFFQEIENEADHYGVFNFTILNFGKTIYQTFKDGCENRKTVEQMTELSEDYTKRRFFVKADFEEETLWTLYALQEGVTSKKERRGTGTVEYLHNFFNLKGDVSKDNISQLVIVSGNTRIIFDGTYQMVEKTDISRKRPLKTITFNNSGDIKDKPDRNFVKFAPNFFPGALISARILIKFENTLEQQEN